MKKKFEPSNPGHELVVQKLGDTTSYRSSQPLADFGNKYVWVKPSDVNNKSGHKFMLLEGTDSAPTDGEKAITCFWEVNGKYGKFYVSHHEFSHGPNGDGLKLSVSRENGQFYLKSNPKRSRTGRAQPF